MRLAPVREDGLPDTFAFRLRNLPLFPSRYIVVVVARAVIFRIASIDSQ